MKSGAVVPVEAECQMDASYRGCSPKGHTCSIDGVRRCGEFAEMGPHRRVRCRSIRGIMTVVGIDACKKGWIVVALSRDIPTAHYIPTIERLLDVVEDVSTIAIDIPIGMPSRGARSADELARKYVGPRRSSVFRVPVRESLEAGDYATANQISIERSGVGLSQQSFALREKVLQVDAWRPIAPCSVWEVHPEVSFRRMLGVPLVHAKKSWAGMNLRRNALRTNGIDVDALVDRAGDYAGTDDLLDAAAAAWSAERISRGAQESFPTETRPSQVDEGNTIWY